MSGAGVVLIQLSTSAVGYRGLACEGLWWIEIAGPIEANSDLGVYPAVTRIVTCPNFKPLVYTAPSCLSGIVR